MLYIDLEVEAENRFDPKRFIPFYGDMFDILDSFLVRQLKSMPPKGNYVVTTEEGRPDLLSKRIYGGDSQYWWMLMLYNDLLSPGSIYTGLEVDYPTLTQLENLYFRLKSLEKKERN